MTSLAKAILYILSFLPSFLRFFRSSVRPSVRSLSIHPSIQKGRKEEKETPLKGVGGDPASIEPVDLFSFEAFELAAEEKFFLFLPLFAKAIQQQQSLVFLQLLLFVRSI